MTTRDEVLGKVGRNLLLFQQAEVRLKLLASQRRIAGITDEFWSKAKELRERIAVETLGTVVRRVTDTADVSEKENERIDAAILETGGIHLEVRCNFCGIDSKPDVGWLERLEALVDDRNELVHHFLERFDLGGQEDCGKAASYLDQQHSRHAPLVEDLRARCNSMMESSNLLAAFLKQEDNLAEFLLGPLRPRLEAVLRKVASERARADRWTYLSLAGKELIDVDSGLLKRWEQAFGDRGLKQVVAAMNDWELRDEPTAGGGTRALYRFRQ